ncbi:DUF6328 family protein [Streptomyces yatensis]|uniref:Integral membrane protein n=1 Tax=Streptomyces yatensis TaxID=155177 RepID=A0ABN2J5G7_9ACTN|nr:DUF6328 family protein [Streptomyces yatensis]
MQEMQYRAPDGEHEGWLEPAEHKGWFEPGHRHAHQAKQGAVVASTMPLPRPAPPVAHQGPPPPGSAPAHHTDQRPTVTQRHTERLHRRYAEILQEVRIAQCGIQILFASLLTLGVTPKFAQPTAFQQWTYCAALGCALGAAGTLLAPAALHRLVRGDHARDALVDSANRCLVAGMAFLALALSTAMTLIMDMAIGGVPALISGAAALFWFLLLWLLGPMHIRRRIRPVRPKGVHTGATAVPDGPVAPEAR